MGEFIKYRKRKPAENKEYLCRFQQNITGIWGAEYLRNTDEGLMVEHPDYNNLEWYDENGGKEDDRIDRAISHCDEMIAMYKKDMEGSDWGTAKVDAYENTKQYLTTLKQQPCGEK